MRLYQQRYVTFFQNSFSQKRRYFLFLFSFHSNCCIYTRKLSILLCIILSLILSYVWRYSLTIFIAHGNTHIMTSHQWAFVYKSDLARGSASFLQLVILVFISIRFVHMIVF